MKPRLLLFAVISILLYSSCVIKETVVSPESGDRIQASGYLIKDIRELSEFNSVSIATCGKVYVKQGAEQMISVIADDNVMEYIYTTVQHKKLRIGIQPGISIRDLSLTVNITIPEIHELATSSSGDIIGQNQITGNYLRLITSSSGDISINLEVERLVSVLSSSGDIYLRGRAKQHDASLSSSGDLYAFNLSTEITNITVSSSGDAEIYVTDLLNANLSSSGDLFYRGMPNIYSNISSSGRIFNAN